MKEQIIKRKDTDIYFLGAMWGYGSMVAGWIIFSVFQTSVLTVFLMICCSLIPSIGYVKIAHNQKLKEILNAKKKQEAQIKKPY